MLKKKLVKCALKTLKAKSQKKWQSETSLIPSKKNVWYWKSASFILDLEWQFRIVSCIYEYFFTHIVQKFFDYFLL